MSAFAQPKAASPSLRENSNPHAKKFCVKGLDIMEVCSLIPLRRLFISHGLLNLAAHVAAKR